MKLEQRIAKPQGRAKSPLSKTIFLVLGEIDPSELGRVLPHEHFEYGGESVFIKAALDRPELAYSNFDLKNLGWIRQFP